VKHVGIFGQVYHRRLAQVAGFDDVVFLDGAGRLSEGATWNIGFVRAGQLIWPQAEYLRGVTMRVLQREIAGGKAINSDAAVTVPVDASSLAGMDAAFATNAAIGVRAIASIDHVHLDIENALLAALSAQYKDISGETL
jgi:branched-subunit amino acid aminotransferase/4-amino-4-deoxychorismate lyase